jgi:uroporphyrinogen-III synthase
VAVTREGDADDRLVGLLESDGATVVVWPTFVVVPPVDPTPLMSAAAGIGRYDWVVFTSSRAVDALSELVPRPQRGIPVAAVGAATARAAERAGWDVRVSGQEGSVILFPAASLAADVLEEALTRAGGRVERVEAYRTVERPPSPDEVRGDLSRGVDVVTFASPSAARGLAKALGGTLSELDGQTRVVAIGPTTEGALRELGARDIAVAQEPGLESLREACIGLQVAER